MNTGRGLVQRCPYTQASRGLWISQVDKKAGSIEAATMDHSQVLLFAFLIGVVGGLRAMSAPAVTAWAAHLGWLNVAATPLKFMGSMITVAIFTIPAIVELVTDQL